MFEGSPTCFTPRHTTAQCLRCEAFGSLRPEQSAPADLTEASANPAHCQFTPSNRGIQIPANRMNFLPDHPFKGVSWV